MRLSSHIDLPASRALMVLGVLGLLFFLSACSTSEARVDLPDEVDFNDHIRPILSNNCFVCHGPDAGTREADVRLDTREHATARRDEGGRAIVPGSARRSLLIQRITAADPDERMPPLDAKKTLSPRDIALLKRWIEQGAEYKEHWSLIPPAPPEVPPAPTNRQDAAAIDRFILARLDAEGLAPAPEASKTALIRRLAYVLTGLPPAPEDVRAFVADDAPDAYEALVDRLLASPQFGERWARHWMDLVRYADSKGHEFDFTIDGTWRYRDYLIRAFNADVPYDQFVTEHLAGDLIDAPRRHPDSLFNESILGTAFFAMGEGKHSPVDVRIDEAERIDNIIDVTTKTFQGLTVACARCHDHKFDPIPTSDYYALYGILESTRFAPTPLLSAHAEARLDSIKTLKSDIRHRLAEQWLDELDPSPQQAGRLKKSLFAPIGGERQGEGVLRQENFSPVVRTVSLSSRPSASTEDTPRLAALGTPLKRGISSPKREAVNPRISSDTTSAPRILGDFRDGSFDGWFAHGPAFGDRPVMGLPVFDRGRMRLDSLAAGVASSRRWAAGVPGALRSPTFIIEHDSLDVVAAGYRSVIRIIIDNFQLIRHPIHGGLDREVDSPELKTYSFDLRLWKGRKAYVELLVGTYDKARFVTEDHRLALSDASYIEAAYAVAYTGNPPDRAVPDPAPRDPPGEAVKEAIGAWARDEADARQVALLNGLLRQRRLDASLDAVAPLIAQVEDVKTRRGGVGFFMGVTEGDAVSSAVFDRGNYKMPIGEPVPHRFFTALDPDGAPFTTTASGRLELARAITHPDNPLTARLMVNRLWHHVFGRGLVETVDNFGAQGKPPTHRALLDYLALRFIEKDWSMKGMIREMVLSQTFRQSTQGAAVAAEVDPENLLLHHYPVRRLEAEAIRDAVLAVSGRLDPTMYGEPVPVHLTEFMEGRGRPEVSGPLDGAGRRSLYLAIRRNFLSPMMLAFDMPIPFSTFGKRNTSNVPAQSLTMLNDPFVAEQAAVWADTLATLRHLDAAQKVDHLFLTALSRPPTEEETTQALAFIREQARHFGLPDDAASDDARPWAAYCHVVFNLKEFIYLI